MMISNKRQSNLVSAFRPSVGKVLLRGAMIGLLGLGAVACASSPAGNVYSARDAGVPSRIKTGVMVEVEPVVIKGDNRGVGVASGAVIGGLAGSQIGGGDEERAIAGVAGAVIGGVIGNSAEKRARTQQGFRYTIDLDGEGLTTIVQADPQPVGRPGSRVRVEYGSRVKVLPSY